MADPKIKLKRSAVAGKIPTPNQLPLGEVALNTYDGYLYASKNVGVGTTVIVVNPFRVGTGTDTYNVYFTAGSVGIGTTTPTAKLDVNGDVSIASTVSIGTTIDIIPYNDLGALSFEGSAGQLFSITNDLTSGSIFSVNDVSGIPSIDVDADGTIQLAPYGSTEYVGIGTTNPTQKLDVVGTVKATSFTGDGSGLTNVTAVGTGVGIQSNTTVVGTAQTINFGTNLSATISDGVATITATSGGGGSTGTATTITLADESTDTECFLIFATDATGDQEPKTGSNLTFNSNTGALTATSFVKESNSSGFLKADGTEDTNTYLTSYTETQTLDDVLGLGNTSDTGLSVGVITATSFVKSDGTSSQFLKADGSVDSSTYLTSFTETNDLSSAVTWANVPDANITESSVTQHQAALSITESQISDLQSYLTSYTETQTLDDVLGLGNTSDTGLSVGIVTATSFVKSSNSGGFLKADGTEDTNTYLTSFTETNDLSSVVTWANVPDANITESSVTQHQAALSITESQISDLQSYLTSYTETQTLDDVLGLGNTSSTGLSVGVITATSFVKESNSGGFLKADGTEDTNTYLTSFTETNDLSSAVTWANVPDANITESSVTQHQAALSITESQISDLQSYLTSYTETQTLDDVLGLGNTSSTGLSVGVVTATSFVKDGGTSSQFLKADGSVDSSTYLTSYTETDPVVAAINGIVKSDGSTISAASAGTDYLAPAGDGSGLSGIVTNIQAGANITVLESPTGNFIVTSTASGGDTVTINATATDILSVSSGDISADDAGADKLVFWDDSESKLTYLTAGSGLSISGTTITASGGGGSSGIEIENSGTSVGTAITSINFSTNLTATASGGIATITASGGGGGGNPVSKSSTETTATGGQTVFNGTYTVGFVDVFLNGSKLDSSEFTATNGTSITLTTGATANDIIEVIGFTFADGSTNIELSNDSSPELAANLDLKGFDIVDSVGGSQVPGQIDALEIMLFT